MDNSITSPTEDSLADTIIHAYVAANHDPAAIEAINGPTALKTKHNYLLQTEILFNQLGTMRDDIHRLVKKIRPQNESVLLVHEGSNGVDCITYDFTTHSAHCCARIYPINTPDGDGGKLVLNGPHGISRTYTYGSHHVTAGQEVEWAPSPVLTIAAFVAANLARMATKQPIL